MLRADLIRKLRETPASESKLSSRSRKTVFEENKLRNCDNISKSLLNVFDSWPEERQSPKKDNLELPKCNKTPKATLNVADSWAEGQRVTRAMSKSPKNVNPDMPICENTPKATLNLVDLMPRSECKTGSKTSDKIRARSISSRAIKFNDFMAKVTASGNRSNLNLPIKTKSNVRSTMNREAITPRSTKPLRFNLHESAMTAKLLNDESPALLISSPDQSFPTAKDILNTPNRNPIERGKWILLLAYAIT